MTGPTRRKRDRRRLISAIGGLGAAGLAALAGCGPILSHPSQQPRRLPRIGILLFDQPGPSPLLDGLLDALHARGYVDGRTVHFERRYAHGISKSLYDLAVELVGLPVELILAPSSVAARAARLATTTIPIVAVGMTVDPTAEKLAARLDRPGTNVTGTVTVLGDHGAKQLSLLRELIPTLPRLAILWNPEHHRSATDPTNHLGELTPAMRAARIQLRSLEVRAASQLPTVFSAARTASVSAMLVLGDLLLLAERDAILEFAASERLPVLYNMRDFVDAGGLMAYGESMRATYRGAADHIDRILQGASPAELPIVRPSWTQLVVNLGTARALGITIPQRLLDQATEVIQ